MERKKIKFLVLGATGMAGHTISLYLHEQGHIVTTFSKEVFPFCPNIIGDALDDSFFITVLKHGDYDVVINCIGVLNTACDLNLARSVYLNSYLPHLIVDSLKDMKTKVMHISTDCVFSGKDGPYSEHSFRNGETFYDRTKALGEIEDSKNLTFRTSIIGPDMKENGLGLFNWFMRQSGVINAYTKAIWTGVTNLTLAKAIEEATIENLTGLYHLVNDESINKYDLLNLFEKYMGAKKVSLLPSKIVELNKSLINNRTDFTFKVPSYEQMITEMVEWIRIHEKIYPHYFK